MDDNGRRSAERRVAGLLVRLDAERRTVEGRATLGAADMRMLWLLSDGRPRTLREISRTLGLEQSTVNRQVNAALRDGLLDRTRGDGTAYLVSPTEHGRELFEREVDRVLSYYAEGVAALGEHTGEFLRLLERFVDGYGESVRGTD